MKDPYHYERNKAKARAGELGDTFDRAPLDFHTEEERHHRAAEIERHRVAELERVREARRKILADQEATEQADKQARIKRHEKWLTAWHIGLLVGGIITLAKIVETQLQ